MIFYLMVLVDEQHWRVLKRGTYDQCIHEAMILPEGDTWMVVQVARLSSGREKIVIGN